MDNQSNKIKINFSDNYYKSNRKLLWKLIQIEEDLQEI